jgi:hypothetical protein
LVALLRRAGREPEVPIDPQLADRVLERLDLVDPADLPRTRAGRAAPRGACAPPEGRGRRQALLIALLALLALLVLPPGARHGARLAQAPGLCGPAERGLPCRVHLAAPDLREVPR